MTSNWQTLAENATAWARARVGATTYATRCLAFVEDAIERGNGIEIFGGDYAAESARVYGVGPSDEAPPFGALVFYDSVGELHGVRQDWGHVGLSVGDGIVIHAWDRVRIDGYLEVESLTPAPGWERASLIGWAPLSRVLEGSCPKSYGSDDPAVTAAEMQNSRFAQH